MFGFRLITLALIVLWGLAFAILKFVRPAAQGAHLRMATLLGMLLTFLAFFFEFWIELDFFGYINPTPELLRKLIPEGLVSRLVRSLGTNWLGSLLDWLDVFTSFNGLTIHFIPTLGWGTWLITWLPLVPLGISIPVLVAGLMARGSGFARAGGWVLLVTSIISAVSLLFVLPHLDAAGTEFNFQLALLATILGAKMGNGPWICLAGLVLLAVGGVIEINDQSSVFNQDLVEGNEW